MKPLSLLLVVLTLLNCSEPLPEEQSPLPEPIAPGSAFILTTALTYTTSSLATFSIEKPSEITDDLLLASGDAVLVKLGHWLGILNRGQDSNLHLIGREGQVGPQYALPGCGPHDALLLRDGRVVISCYEAPELQILSLESGEIELFSLEHFADADGLPELDHLALVGDVLYVTAQRLDRENGFSATQAGLLIGVHIPSLTLMDLSPEQPNQPALELPCRNPYTRLATTSRGSLLVGCVADFQTPTHAGLLEIFPDTAQVEVITSAETLGGYPSDLRVSPEGTPWVQIYTPSPHDPYTTQQMAILSLEPTPQPPRITHAGFTLAGFDFDSRGTLYYALRGQEAPGLYRLSEDNSEVLPPLVLTLPPMNVAFF